LISLKKYIESRPEESLKAMCQSYRDSLTAIGTSATQICPHIGEDVRDSLLNLRDQLSPEANPGAVAATGKLVEGELRKWGESASEYLQQTAHDVKEIMLIVAETTQAAGDRNQKYARQFSEFAGQLASIGKLEDLTKVRQSLEKSARQLKSCVEKMVQDGEQSDSRLRAELSTYQSRLDELERVATHDPVTGVANRYKAERQIQLRIQSARNLSIAIFDLDDFKRTNDLHGHPAGDALLRQFAAELRSFFRPADIVSRWGGDEFLVVVDCAAEEVRDRIEPVRKWVYGDYKIQVDGKTLNVGVNASVGMASWKPGETAADLIARADAAMYLEKTERRKALKPARPD
jgi:diguanylate cyclase (GGDEF)-like protein